MTAVVAKKRPNWLLAGFVSVSLVIHVFIFLHIAGIYQSSAISYIELSMHEFSKPDVRQLPTPRNRQKAPKVSQVKAVQPKKFSVPKIRIDRVKTQKMDSSYETVSMPELPDGINIGGLNVPNLKVDTGPPDVTPHQEEVTFTTAKEYFEMLLLRIQSAKKYPESAKSRHIEGRTGMQFTLKPDGSVTDIRVVKSSRNKSLDDAAIQAVKDAAPFHRLPSFISEKAIPVSFTLVFELV